MSDTPEQSQGDTPFPTTPQVVGTRSILHWQLLGALAIAVLTVFCFSRVLDRNIAFVLWDDDINIFRNPHIRALDWESIRWMFTDIAYVRRYVPLSWLGLAINYQFAGLDPWSYHAVSVLIHVINAVLVYWIIARLLRFSDPGRPQSKEWQIHLAAGLAALLWAVQPIRVEGVAWAAGRIYPQSALFFLICVICYLRAVGQSARAPWRTVVYWISVLAFAASLGTHQIAITGLGILCVLDIYPLRRFGTEPGCYWNRHAAAIWLEKLPYLGVTVAFVVIAYVARINASGPWDPPPTWEEFPLLARIMQAFYIVAHYVWKPWSIDGYSPVYLILERFDPLSPLFLGSAFFVLAFTALVFVLRRRYPLLAAIWVCHLLLVLPVTGATQHPHFPADRYSYLDGVVWSALIAAGLTTLWARADKLQSCLVIGSVAAIAVIGFGILGYHQTAVWRNSETFFRHIIAELGTDPYRWDIHRRLADFYMQEQRYPEAIEQADASLNLRSNNPHALKTKAGSLIQLADKAVGYNQIGPAIEGYARAAETLTLLLDLEPSPQLVEMAGIAYTRGGRLQEAESTFRAGIARYPAEVPLQVDLAQVLWIQGRTAEAQTVLQNAVSKNPEQQPMVDKILRDWKARAAPLPATKK